MPRIQREPGETWRSTVIMPFSRQWLYKRQFENDDWLSPAGVRRLCPGREESRGAHTHTHTHTYPHPHRHSHTQTHPHTRARIPNERKPTLSARPPADVVFDPTTLRVFPQSCPSITAPLPRYIYIHMCVSVHAGAQKYMGPCRGTRTSIYTLRDTLACRTRDLPAVADARFGRKIRREACENVF